MNSLIFFNSVDYFEVCVLLKVRWKLFNLCENFVIKTRRCRTQWVNFYPSACYSFSEAKRYFRVQSVACDPMNCVINQGVFISFLVEMNDDPGKMLENFVIKYRTVLVA